MQFSLSGRRLWPGFLVPLLLAVVLLPASAIASPPTDQRARVTFTPKPAHLTFRSTATGTARFRTDFASISSLCVTFHFARDLIDPGDEVEFSFEGQGGSFSYDPNTAASLSQVTVCIDENNSDVLALFLDGENDFTVLMLTGTAMLTRIQITASGVPA